MVSKIAYQNKSVVYTIINASYYGLYIITQNLVKNAFEHSPGCNLVLDYKDGYITIKDDGVGISKYKLATTFSSFSSKDDNKGEAGLRVVANLIGRIIKPFSNQKSNRGLGLKIVVHLVEKMNAQITVDSVLGKGTSFSLRLPKI